MNVFFKLKTEFLYICIKYCAMSNRFMLTTASLANNYGLISSIFSY